MPQKKRSYAGKKQYGMYQVEGRYAKNKKAKLERHLKKFPNDAKALAALKCIKEYSRKKSHTRGHFPEANGYVYDGAGHKEQWTSPAGVERYEKGKKPRN